MPHHAARRVEDSLQASPPQVSRLQVSPVTPALDPSVRQLRVAPDQQRFVGDPGFHLDDAQRNPASTPMAILVDGTVIGFYRIEQAAHLLAGRAFAAPALGIRNLLIDRAHQRRGFGVKAIRALCADLHRRYPGHALVVLTVHRCNRLAMAAYLRAGFDDSGESMPGGSAGVQALLIHALRPAADMGH